MFEYQGVKKWRGQKLEQEKIKTFFPLKWQVTVVFERAKMKLILPRGLFLTGLAGTFARTLNNILPITRFGKP